MIIRTIRIILLALGVCVATASSQTTIYSFEGNPYDWCYGLSNPMKLDGDPVPDFVLTCFGQAFAISGQTGEILYSFATPEFAAEPRRIGDLDGDGLDDYILGQPYLIDVYGYAGLVTVHSGADGTVLFFEYGFDDTNGDGAGDMLGWDVDGCGDVDGDGYPDFIYSGVGDNGIFEPCAQTTDGGFVLVRSGYDGSVLKAYTGNPNCNGIGGSVVGLGDLDADGYDDYGIMGMGDIGGVGNFFTVRSGFDHSQLRVHLPYLGQEFLGQTAARLGDLDGDGVADYALGSPLNDGSSAFGWDSFVDIFSGATGNLVHGLDFFAYGSSFDDYFGWSVCDLGDVDADGHDDFALSAVLDDVAGATDNGRVFILSGYDASVIQTLFGAQPGQLFGAGLCGIGDINFDGGRELVVSSLNMAGFLDEAGQVEMISLDTLSFSASPHIISVSAGGTIDFALNAGPAEAGQTYFVIGSATGFAPGVATPNGLLVPLVADSYFMGTIDPNLNPIANWTGYLDILGRGNASLAIPAGYLPPQAAGITIYHAFVTYGFALGNFSFVSNHVISSFSL